MESYEIILKIQVVAPTVDDSIIFHKTMTVAEQAMYMGISGNLGGLSVERGKTTQVIRLEKTRGI